MLTAAATVVRIAREVHTRITASGVALITRKVAATSNAHRGPVRRSRAFSAADPTVGRVGIQNNALIPARGFTVATAPIGPTLSCRASRVARERSRRSGCSRCSRCSRSSRCSWRPAGVEQTQVALEVAGVSRDATPLRVAELPAQVDRQTAFTRTEKGASKNKTDENCPRNDSARLATPKESWLGHPGFVAQRSRFAHLKRVAVAHLLPRGRSAPRRCVANA